jgi:uncharacterized protein (DUF305 family)
MRRHQARWRRPLLLAIVLATALLFGPTMIASAVPGPQRVPPVGAQQLDQLSGDAFDQAFLTQMTMHHAMGVMMTQPVATGGAHQELKALGAQMIADQSREIAQMRGWLQTWYGLDASCPMMPGMMTGTASNSMPGMMPGQPGARPGAGPMWPGAMQPGTGMPMMPGAMPGMTPGGPAGAMPMTSMPMIGMPMLGMPMMGSFWSLPPDQLDETFMTWMIAHHQGAIDMAALAEERAGHQEVKDLAAGIIASQSGEIETMQGWLAAWYGR